jgi:NAD+ synthase (glutamine-hydrolysing)
MVFDAKGQMLDELPYFKEAIGLYEFKDQHIQHLQPLEHQPVPDIEQIHDALILGIKDYFEKSGFKKAVLGLSGGIDSAIVCALACRALGAENVMAVLMPSKYSTDHSVQDALDLVKNMGCQHEIIPIKEAADAFDQMMAPAFHDLPFNLTEENIQARCRGVVVMAMSNKFGYILLNTSNKSECAVGYGTLYGDMCGAIGVIGDVYKTQVYQLAHYINKDAEVIPENSIVKPPSAELRPGQKDSDSLPDYDILDQILFQYIELKKSSSAIIAQGFDEALVRRIIKMVNTAEFKRYQTPPILRVSPKAFGMGRRMPIVGKYLS